MADYDLRSTVELLRRAHRTLQGVIEALSEEQLTGEPVLDNWPVKDMLAHIAAWNRDYVLEIDRILADRATWHRLGEGGVDAFNQRATEAQQETTLTNMLAEWEDSFRAFIARAEQISEEEWEHQSGADEWGNGYPVTLASLFFYEHKMGGHEAEHAAQIAAHFGLKLIRD
jgi:uncharacterized damage-inducible protein DinB